MTDGIGPPDLDAIELPAFLERADGEIRIAGHRVSLFRIVDDLMRGTPPGWLPRTYPTVPAEKLADTVAFWDRHRAAAIAYHGRRLAEFDAEFGGRIGTAPSLAELRRRRADREGRRS